MADRNAAVGVICADRHLGFAQQVGVVIAYEKQNSISGIGFDIRCGNMAVRLDAPYAEIVERMPDILADIRRLISFGVGRNNKERVEHELFYDDDPHIQPGRDGCLAARTRRAGGGRGR